MKSDGPKTNHLEYWRKQRNLSLNKLSMRMGGDNYASAATLMRWEKGSIKEWAVPVLAKALKISESELIEGPAEKERTPATNTAISYIGIDTAIAESVITLGYTSWLASKPNEAQRAVQTILPLLEAGQQRGLSARHAKDEKYTMARAYELLGALALDRMEYDTAITEFRRALTKSEEIGESNLIAAHMTEIGEAYRRNGDILSALDIMKSALTLARRNDKATLGYVLEMLAYTYAENRDELSFRHHIEEAINLLGHSGSGEGMSQREFVPFEVLEIYGKGLRDFGHAKEGLTYLQRADDSLMMQPNMPRWQAVVTISKAQALCDAGEMDEGIALAVRGLRLAHYCQSPRQMNRVRKLATRLKKTHSGQSSKLILLEDTVRDIYLGNEESVIWHPQHPM